MKVKEIAGNMVIIRPLVIEYIDAYLAILSPSVRAALHIESLESERVYLQEQLIKQREGKTQFYTIFDRPLNVLIGAIEIRDSSECRGQLYCWLNEQFWGTGRFQEAMTLVARAYFAHTRHCVLNAFVDVTNVRSYYALKKAGFADMRIHNGPWGKQYELALRKR